MTVYLSLLIKNQFVFNLTTINYFLSQHEILLVFTLSFLLNLLPKIIFSAQNSNLMYSVELSSDLVQVHVRETVNEIQVRETFWILSLSCTNINDNLLFDLVLYDSQVCFSTKQHRLTRECVIFMSVEISIFAGFYIM